MFDGGIFAVVVVAVGFVMGVGKVRDRLGG